MKKKLSLTETVIVEEKDSKSQRKQKLPRDKKKGEKAREKTHETLQIQTTQNEKEINIFFKLVILA